MNLLPPNEEWPMGLPRQPNPDEQAYGVQLQLHPSLIYPYTNLNLRLQRLGHDPRTMQAWRSAVMQAELWAKGRTTPGPIVTHARPGSSPHENTENGKPAALAFDIAPVIGHHIYWPTDLLSAPFWSDVRDSAKMLGLLWGGNFKNPPGDYGHIQSPYFTGIKK